MKRSNMLILTGVVVLILFLGVSFDMKELPSVAVTNYGLPCSDHTTVFAPKGIAQLFIPKSIHVVYQECLGGNDSMWVSFE